MWGSLTLKIPLWASLMVTLEVWSFYSHLHYLRDLWVFTHTYISLPLWLELPLWGSQLPTGVKLTAIYITSVTLAHTWVTTVTLTIMLMAWVSFTFTLWMRLTQFFYWYEVHSYITTVRLTHTWVTTMRLSHSYAMCVGLTNLLQVWGSLTFTFWVLDSLILELSLRPTHT